MPSAFFTMSNSTYQDSWDYRQIFFLSKGGPWSTRSHLWNWAILKSKQQRDASLMSFQSLSKVITSKSKMRINSKQTENSTISEKLNLGEKKWYKEMNLKGRILRVRMTLVRDERVRRDESREETDRDCGEMKECGEMNLVRRQTEAAAAAADWVQTKLQVVDRTHFIDRLLWNNS